MRNRVKDMLRAGKTAIGCWVWTGHPDIAEMLSSIGFDWLLIDTEHGPIGIETAQTMLQAAKGTDTVPVIRVAWNDPVLIKRALDIGAYGILVPWVNNSGDAARAVQACRYPPRGIRGSGPRRASMYLKEAEEYLATADKEIMVIVQIETADAVRNIDDILSVDGVDAYFVGPGDLSASLGYLGQIRHPRVLQVINEVLDRGRRAGVPAGIYALGPDDAGEWISRGFRLVSIGADTSFLMNAAAQALNEVRRFVK